MVMLLATDTVLEHAAEVGVSVARSPHAGIAGRVLVAAGLLLFRGIVLTGRGVAFTGRAAAGVFASSFDAAVTAAAAKDADGRPLSVWPPRQF